MGYYCVVGRDRANSLQLRQDTRERHRAHLRRSSEFGVVMHVAGPVLDAGGAMCGTLLVVEAVDQASVERFLKQDPYCQAQLFAELTINAFVWGIGQPDSH